MRVVLAETEKMCYGNHRAPHGALMLFIVRPYRLMVRTKASQALNRSSILRKVMVRQEKVNCFTFLVA